MIIKPLFLLFSGILLLFNLNSDSETENNVKDASTYVDMSQGKYRQSDLLKYSNLRTLDLSNNHLNRLPSTMLPLKDLEYLILDGNMGIDVSSVYNFINSPLRKLSMEDCKLYHIPSGISKLTSLQSIDLSNNYLFALSYDFASLKNLKSIDLSNNQLTRLDYAPNFWWRLEEIDVSNNPDLHIESFLDALLYLDNLTTIKMSHLEKVPSNFSNVRVEHFIITDSPELKFNGALAANSALIKITFKGEVIAMDELILEANASASLRELKIENDLSVLPSSLLKATTINKLDLSNNNFSSIEQLKKLTFLSTLDVSGNPLTEIQISELDKALPNTTLVFNQCNYAEPEPLIKINPIPNKDVSFIEKKVNPKVGSNLVFDNAVFDIPSNAFMDVSGNVVTGPVTVNYRDISSPADIILSGVPMKYDSAGVQYNFSSAGMFEFRAFDENGNELLPNPENPINMSFNSRSNEAQYSMYVYDEGINQWTPSDMGARQTIDTSTLLARSLNGNVLGSGVTAPVRMSGAFLQRIAANRIYTERISFKVRTHRKSNSFTFQFRHYSTKGVDHLRTMPHERILERYTVVYDGKNYGTDINYLDSISCDINEVYRKIQRGSDYNIDGPVFISDVYLEPSADRNNKILVIEYKDTVLRYPVYVYREEGSTDNMIRYSSRFMKKYERSEKIGKRNDKILNYAIDREAKRIEADMAKAGINLSIAEYEAQMKAYQEAMKRQQETTRSITMRRFGVVNCDVISRMKNPQYVLAKFISTGTMPRDLNTVYFVDFKKIIVLPQYNPTNILIDADSDFSLVFLDADGNLSVLPKERLTTFDYESKACTIPLDFVETKDMSPKEIKALIKA